MTDLTSSRLLAGLLLASCTLSVVACASPTDQEGESAEAQDNDLKKKVKPKGGNGAFDLVAPGFNAAGFAGTFTFDSAALKPGERAEKVPGSYWLQSVLASFPDGQLMNQQLSYEITAGAIAQHRVGGLRIRFSEPVTLGSTRVDFAPELGGDGALLPGGPWQSAPNGSSMLALAGKVTVNPATEGVAVVNVITEGALKDIVLPTVHVNLSLDSYDPDYPTPACQQTFVRAGASGYAVNANVRKADGSPNASFVVPQGTRAPVVINSYGLEVSQPTVAGKTNTFTLNRLEIDDVEVMKAGGGSQFVRGTVAVSRKNPDGTFTNLNCTIPTHSGLDLPDGAYRLVSRAQSPSGIVTSTEEVTFP